MAEALEKVVIPNPARRPKGVTLKQWRLAALLPRAENAYQAMVAAGYTPASARSDALVTRERPGLKRASEAIEKSQADKARGIIGLANEAIELGRKRIDDLDARELLTLGVNATKIAYDIGANVESTGDGNAWKRRLHQYVERAFLRGRRSAEAGLPLRLRER